MGELIHFPVRRGPPQEYNIAGVYGDSRYNLIVGVEGDAVVYLEGNIDTDGTQEEIHYKRFPNNGQSFSFLAENGKPPVFPEALDSIIAELGDEIGNGPAQRLGYELRETIAACKGEPPSPRG